MIEEKWYRETFNDFSIILTLFIKNQNVFINFLLNLHSEKNIQKYLKIQFLSKLVN